MEEAQRDLADTKRLCGVVSKLWRYPVKSMLGEKCSHLDLNERGVVGDRIFAVRDANGKIGSGKTTRRFGQIDGLFAFRAAYQGDVPEITFPDGPRLAGNDTNLNRALSNTLGQRVTLVREAGVSHLDAGALHLLTTASLAWLKEALPNARIDERRFRPNIVIDVGDAGQVERAWLGQTLCVGPEVRLRICGPTERCRMVTLAQAELPSDLRILDRIARDRDFQFGVYADVLVPGRITCGDEIFGDVNAH